MATKKFKCKVCGYIHEGDAAPAKCPACQAPASEFEEITEGGQPKKKGINTSSNTYTIIYASVVVIIVAFLLAFVSKALEPQSMANVRIDKKSQILAAPRIRKDLLWKTRHTAPSTCPFMFALETVKPSM